MTTGVTQTLFAQALARYTGLTYTASLAWASAEVGRLNNLGIMSGGQPVAYATPAAGAKAAAALIASSSLYAGIRASVGKSAQAQMDAIARSPWHLGPSGLAAAGGLDPYYARVFAKFGYVSGSSGRSGPAAPPAGSSGGSGPAAPPAGSSGGATVPVRRIFLETFRRLKTAKLDSYYANAWAQFLTEARDTGGSNPYFPWLTGSADAAMLNAQTAQTKAALVAAIGPYIGTAYGSLPDSISAALPDQLKGQDPISLLADAITTGLPNLVVNGAVLVLILVLAYSGLQDLLE